MAYLELEDGDILDLDAFDSFSWIETRDFYDHEYVPATIGGYGLSIKEGAKGFPVYVLKFSKFDLEGRSRVCKEVLVYSTSLKAEITSHLKTVLNSHRPSWSKNQKPS